MTARCKAEYFEANCCYERRKLSPKVKTKLFELLGGTGATVTKATIRAVRSIKTYLMELVRLITVKNYQMVPIQSRKLYRFTGTGTLTSTTYVNGQQASTKRLETWGLIRNNLRLTSNSTAKNNGDGTYTNHHCGLRSARDGDVVAPDRSGASGDLPPARYGYFGGSTGKALTVRLTGHGVDIWIKNGTFLKAPKLKGTYLNVYLQT